MHAGGMCCVWSNLYSITGSEVIGKLDWWNVTQAYRCSPLNAAFRVTRCAAPWDRVLHSTQPQVMVQQHQGYSSLLSRGATLMLSSHECDPSLFQISECVPRRERRPRMPGDWAPPTGNSFLTIHTISSASFFLSILCSAIHAAYMCGFPSIIHTTFFGSSISTLYSAQIFSSSLPTVYTIFPLQLYTHCLNYILLVALHPMSTLYFL